MKCWREQKGWHEPDGTDYEQELKAQGVDTLINANKIDEVWLFGAPYMGF